MHVGIDVSKKTLDIAITEDGDKIKGWLKTSNSLKGFREIHAWILNYKEDNADVYICLEATGKYGEKLVDYFHQKTAFSVAVCNAFMISSFAKSRLSRIKTDKSDAALIACYSARMKPAATLPENPVRRKLKEKLRYIHSIKGDITAEKSKLDHYSDPKIKTFIKSNITRMETHISKLQNEVMCLKESDTSFQKNHNLLVSIPSISTQTALVLLTEMIPQSPGSISRKAQTAHAGLAPSIKQSGTSVLSSRLSSYASSRLKNALYFPTLSALRYNPVIASFYNHLLEKGKPKMVAVIACMRKLLHICIGVLNNQLPFSPDFKSSFPYSVAA